MVWNTDPTAYDKVNGDLFEAKIELEKPKGPKHADIKQYFDSDDELSSSDDNADDDEQKGSIISDLWSKIIKIETKAKITYDHIIIVKQNGAPDLEAEFADSEQFSNQLLATGFQDEQASRLSIVHVHGIHDKQQQSRRPRELTNRDFMLTKLINTESEQLASSSPNAIRCRCVNLARDMTIDLNGESGESLVNLLYPLIPNHFQNRRRRNRPELWPLIWARKVAQRRHDGLFERFLDSFNENNLVYI